PRGCAPPCPRILPAACPCRRRARCAGSRARSRFRRGGPARPPRSLPASARGSEMDSLYRSTRGLVRDAVALVAVHDEDRTVGGDNRAVDRATHIDFGQQLLGAAVLENDNVAVFVPEIDFAVGDVGRGPHGGEHVVLPKLLA